VYEFEGSTLSARGCVIDVVKSLGGSQSAAVEAASDVSLFNNASPDDVLMSVCRSLVLGRGGRYMQHDMPRESMCRDFLQLCLILMTDSSHLVHEAFRQWCENVRNLKIHGPTLENLLRDVLEAHGTADMIP